MDITTAIFLAISLFVVAVVVLRTWMDTRDGGERDGYERAQRDVATNADEFTADLLARYSVDSLSVAQAREMAWAIAGMGRCPDEMTVRGAVDQWAALQRLRPIPLDHHALRAMADAQRPMSAAEMQLQRINAAAAARPSLP